MHNIWRYIITIHNAEFKPQLQLLFYIEVPTTKSNINLHTNFTTTIRMTTFITMY